MTGMQGVTYALWQRNRIGLWLILGYTVAFSASLVLAGGRRNDGLLALGVLVLLLSYLFLVAVFIHQDSDVGAARSSYPSYMFTLPVKTSRLVLVPMMLATVTVFAFAFLLTLSARSAGASISLFWPSALATTFVAVLQAIFWFPWGIPYTKLILTLTAIPLLATGVGMATNANAPEWSICLGLATMIALSYQTAYIGVGRARRGDSREIGSTRAAQSVARPVKQKAPFRSAGQAQRWYELRQHGVVLPAVAALLTGLFYVPMVWNTTLSPVPGIGPNADGIVATIPTYVSVYYPVLLFLVPCASWIIGCGLKRSDVKRGDRTFQLFYGTRPMSDADMIGAKLKATAISTLWAWGIVLLLSLPILTMGGATMDVRRELVFPDQIPLFALLPRYVDGRAVLLGGVFVALLAVMTWRNYVIGFWTELSGKLWLRYAYPISFGIGYALLVVWGAQTSPRDGRASAWFTFAAFVIAVWIALTAKFLTAIWLAVTEYRRGILKPCALAWSAATFVVGCAAFVGMGALLSVPLREGLVGGQVASPIVIDSTAFALLVLWTPLNRILAAPIMLSINRHRNR